MKKVSPADKDIITVEEAIDYYGLILVNFRRLLRENDDLPFRVRYFGKRTLIIRVELENYLDKHNEIRSNKIWHKVRTAD